MSERPARVGRITCRHCHQRMVGDASGSWSAGAWSCAECDPDSAEFQRITAQLRARMKSEDIQQPQEMAVRPLRMRVAR